VSAYGLSTRWPAKILRDPELSVTARMVGLALAAHAFWQQNLVRVESRNLPRWTGYSESQIADAISELCRHRFVESERGKTGGSIAGDRKTLKLNMPNSDANARGSRNGQRIG
jgi:hypothetical protein